MQPVAYPLAFGHWHLQKDLLVCRLPRRTVSVTAPGALLQRVLELCDGRLAWREVARRLALHWSPHSVEAFLSTLSREGALVEAGEALARWTDLAQFPTPFPRIADAQQARALPGAALGRLLPGAGPWGSSVPEAGAPLAGLLRRRQSRRTFSDVPIAADLLAAILWAAHGVTRPSCDGETQWHRTVASGGNMHGTRWFAVILRPLPGTDAAEPLQAGVYEARFHLEGGVSFTPVADADAARAWGVLLDPRPLRFASAMVVPVCDVSLPARKYGNRATLFCTFEVGQSLQNAQLMATALQVGSSVRGDTSAAAVLDLLQSHPGLEAARAAQLLVLPALLLGADPAPAEVQLQQQGRWIRMGPATALLAPGGTASAPAGHAFFAGPVALGSSLLYAMGRARTAAEAAAKAEAEAWERLGWATLRPAAEGTAHDIAGALDPRTVVAYAPWQYRQDDFPCTPFTPRRKYAWVAGADAQTGARVLLPAECIHALSALPQRFRRNAYTNSSTSGIAAWTNPEGALCRGTLELLERDAFLRAWLARVPPARMLAGTLPAHEQKRIAGLEHAGHRVAVLALASALVPVFAVFVQSASRAFTAVTAAADLQPEVALARAVDEAIGRAAHAASFPAQPLKRSADVRTPEDINRLYQSPRFHRRADWFAEGETSRVFGSEAGWCSDWTTLQARLAQARRRLLAFDLTPPHASLDQGRTPLRVVRAVVPGLLPIWFQHGLEPAGLESYAEAAAVRRSGRTACGTTFIHPFT